MSWQIWFHIQNTYENGNAGGVMRGDRYFYYDHVILLRFRRLNQLMQAIAEFFYQETAPLFRTIRQKVM